MFTRREIEYRESNVDSVLRSIRAEGHEPSDKIKELLNRYTDGDLSMSQVRRMDITNNPIDSE